MPNATLTPAAGVGNVLLNPSRVGIPRSQSVYENVGVQSLSVLARSQYVYENIGIQALAVLARAAYLYEASIDGEVFPWLMDMRPRQQYRGARDGAGGDYKR